MQPQREQMLQEIIRSHQLGALIFWRPDELVLMLDYLPLWGVSFLVYTATGGPVLFVPEVEPADLLPAGADIRVYPWGNLHAADPWQQLYTGINALLKEQQVQNKPVSFIPHIGGTALPVAGGEQPPLAPDLITALAALGAGYKDASADLLKTYWYKSTADIARLTLTHRVTAAAIAAFDKAAIPGNTEAAVVAAVESAVTCTIGEQHIHFAKAWAQVQSGVNAAFGGRYNRTTGRKLQDGEMVMMELAVCVNGYWSDITRTAQLGKIPARQAEMYRIVNNAKELAIGQMKPGVMMGSIYDVARRYIEKYGYGEMFNHALGHHVGFRYHDPGPALVPGSPALLEEGMLMTVEPGIYAPELGGGVRIEENVFITAAGCRLLSCY